MIKDPFVQIVQLITLHLSKFSRCWVVLQVYAVPLKFMTVVFRFETSSLTMIF